MRVQLEGQDEPVEVSPDQVEVEDNDPFLTQDEVDGVVQSRLNRQENNLRDNLLNDDAFWQEMAQARGVELRDDGMPKGSATDEEIQELRRKASQYDSIQEENESLKQQIQETRRERLRQDLRENAPPTANETAQDTFLNEATSRMEYDDEYGWVEVDENGDIVYEAGEPRGPQDVVSELEDSHSFLFESTEVDGGSDVSPSGGTGGKLTQSEFKQEVEKARRSGDMKRMQELEEMEAAGEVVPDE